MISFGQYVIDFNKNLLYNETLLEGIAVLNPYHNNTETMNVMQAFYYKYTKDNSVRKFLIGINTSRHGDGVIYIPFTHAKSGLPDGIFRF